MYLFFENAIRPGLDCLAAGLDDLLALVGDLLNRFARQALLFGGVLHLLHHLACSCLCLFVLLRGNAADRLLDRIARLAKIAVLHLGPGKKRGYGRTQKKTTGSDDKRLLLDKGGCPVAKLTAFRQRLIPYSPSLFGEPLLRLSCISPYRCLSGLSAFPEAGSSIGHTVAHLRGCISYTIAHLGSGIGCCGTDTGSAVAHGA